MDKNLKLIRDVVYEYVYFTPVEALIIESPIFQRLRFVYQNSSAYLTYPSNQLSRFTHSLGVMHMGSSMIIAALKNSPDEDFWEFVHSIEKRTEDILMDTGLFGGSINTFQNSWPLGNVSDFAITDKLKYSMLPQIKSDPIFLINYLWQSIRIACLIHDIGHFPFSHVFEMGLETFKIKYGDRSDAIDRFRENIANALNIDSSDIESPTEVHEYFGTCILTDYLDSLKQSDVKIQTLKLCLKFAIEIFTYDSDKDITEIHDNGFLLSLHQVVSSFLDADRIDYVLRDSLSSGLQVGNFDYKRLIDSLIIVRVSKRDENVEKKLFALTITDKALSSVEQFYNHRYILYEYLYFHHNVCKYDGILMEIISEIMKISLIDNDQELIDLLLRVRFLTSTEVNDTIHLELIFNGQKSIVSSVSMFDDCWLRSILQEILWLKSDTLEYKKLKFLIEIFLFRETNNTYSVIKKDPDVDIFLEEFISFLKDDKSHLHGELVAVIIASNATFKMSITNEVKFIRYLFSNYFRDEREKSLKSNFIRKMHEVTDGQVTFIHKEVKPKLVDEGARILFNGEYDYCINVSPYLESSKQIMKTSFNHYFGFAALGIKDDEDLKKKCRGFLFEALLEVLDSCIKEEYSEINSYTKIQRRH